MKAAFGLS